MIEQLQPPQFGDWLPEWDRFMAGNSQAGYVANQLRALRDSGEHRLLTAALMLPFPEQIDLATRALRESGYRPWLRLRDGATPHPRDPQGRPLPREKAGKVLVAKVGVRGQMDPSELSARNDETRMYSGPARSALARTAQGLYVTTEITSTPTQHTLADATVILRQWGVGFGTRAVTRGGQEIWLVEEVPDPALAPPAPTHTEPRKRAA